MTLKRATPFVLAFFAISLAFWSWWTPSQPKKETSSEDGPSVSIDSFQQVQYDQNGEKVAELSGSNLILDSENVIIQSPKLKTQFQSKFWTIEASMANAQKRMRELDLQGNVNIYLTKENNLLITTPKLHYSLTKKLLSSEQSVEIQDPPFNFIANGIEVDLTSEKYLLSGGIRGEEYEQQ